jgi:hypothetical protein
MIVATKRRMKMPGNVELKAGDTISNFETYPEKVRKRLLDIGWVEEVASRRGRPPGSKNQPEVAEAIA